MMDKRTTQHIRHLQLIKWIIVFCLNLNGTFCGYPICENMSDQMITVTQSVHKHWVHYTGSTRTISTPAAPAFKAAVPSRYIQQRFKSQPRWLQLCLSQNWDIPWSASFPKDQSIMSNRFNRLSDWMRALVLHIEKDTKNMSKRIKPSSHLMLSTSKCPVGSWEQFHSST